MANIPSLKTFEEVAHLPTYNDALPGIVQLLTSMVQKGDAVLSGQLPTDRSMFNGSQPAAVSVQDYILRLCKYGFCSREVFVVMVVYLGRLRAMTSMHFTSYNVHRLILTAFTVAAKLRDDTYYSNKYYAKIGGVTLQDINRMEAAFLTQTNWDMYVDNTEYVQYYKGLVRAAAAKEETSPEASASKRVHKDCAAATAATSPKKKTTSPLQVVKNTVMQRIHKSFSRNSSGLAGSSSGSLASQVPTRV